ncbi:predicted protein, partial [Nematostella vectensis]
WTVIQQRSSDSVDFRRTFDEYSVGIGTPEDDNFMLGFDNIHRLTNSSGAKMLRVRLQDWGDIIRGNTFAKIAQFLYSLIITITLSFITGDAGDSLDPANGMKFSTYDQDNDQKPGQNCAAQYGGGGWWHKACFHCNLNNPYYNSAPCPLSMGIIWYTWRGHYYSMKKVAMLVRNV